MREAYEAKSPSHHVSIEREAEWGKQFQLKQVEFIERGSAFAIQPLLPSGPASNPQIEFQYFTVHCSLFAPKDTSIPMAFSEKTPTYLSWG